MLVAAEVERHEIGLLSENVIFPAYALYSSTESKIYRGNVCVKIIII